TVTVIGMTASAAFGSWCRTTTRPSAVGTTVTGAFGSSARASARETVSPSGSTQPASTGTETNPPGATWGVDHSCRQPSTPHQTGAVFCPSGTTVRVTVAVAETAAPSVTA